MPSTLIFLEVEEFDYVGAHITGRDASALLRSTSADPGSGRARLVAIIEPELDLPRSPASIEQAEISEFANVGIEVPNGFATTARRIVTCVTFR